MNPSSSIEIVITPTGEVKLQTRGFTGPACREASRVLEQALGLIVSDTPTAEMHQSTQQPQVLHQQGS